MEKAPIWLAITALVLGIAGGTPAAAAEPAKKKCFFVSSYHRGYDHSDAIERGVRSVLAGKCEVRQFDMDTKRRQSDAEQKQQALAAKAIIESWQPDIVITADDNVAKYLIQPYYKDHKLPFVFCGLNWTAKEYGFPYKNVTGMIEVAPIVPMLERAMQIVPSVKRVFYVGAQIHAEEKNLKRFQQAATQLGFQLDHMLADSTDAWVEAYKRAQEYDLVVVGSSEGIIGWDAQKAQAAVLENTRKLSVTNHDWMMPFTILGVTKVSEEQGEWAAKTALRILEGMSPAEIPIVPNNRRDTLINAEILAAGNISLPDGLLRRAKKVGRLASR